MNGRGGSREGLFWGWRMKVQELVRDKHVLLRYGVRCRHRSFLAEIVLRVGRR